MSAAENMQSLVRNRWWAIIQLCFIDCICIQILLFFTLRKTEVPHQERIAMLFQVLCSLPSPLGVSHSADVPIYVDFSGIYL